MTFIDEVLAGRKGPDDIDDAVEDWHLAGQAQPGLPEVLGMTTAEYRRWVLDPDVLEEILALRRAERGEANR